MRRNHRRLDYVMIDAGRVIVKRRGSRQKGLTMLEICNVNEVILADATKMKPQATSRLSFYGVAFWVNWLESHGLAGSPLFQEGPPNYVITSHKSPREREQGRETPFTCWITATYRPVDCHSWWGRDSKDIMRSAPRSVRRGWLQQRRRVRHLLKQHWPDPSGLDAYRNFDR